MSKPIIGIVEYPYEDKDGDLIYEVLSPVIESVSKAGGRAIGIFPTQIADFQNERLRNIPDLTKQEKIDIVDSIEICDAIIKPGAVKIFGFDRFIYHHVLQKNIPFLGICAGMQTMAAHNKEWIQNQNGNLNNIEISNKVISIKSPKAGIVTSIDAYKLGNIAKKIGAGRNKKEDKIDYTVGLVLNKKVGDLVLDNEEIIKVYLNERDIDLKEIVDCFVIEDIMPEKKDLIIKIIK